MRSRHRHEDDDDDDFDEDFNAGDDEYENDVDYGDDSDEATVPCPHCKREVHEDCQRCPHCDEFISSEDAPRPLAPWWIVIGILIVLGMVYCWTMHPWMP